MIHKYLMEPIDIIVISLRESTARRARAVEQLQASGLTWRFQDAIKGADLPALPVEYDQNRRYQLEGNDLNPGEIGCFMSHREAWKMCVKTQKLMLILEDDFQFQETPADVLSGVFENLPHFDVLRLQGGILTYKYKVLKDYGKTKLVRHYRDPHGTTAYVLKPAAAKKLLERSRKFFECVDIYLGNYGAHRLRVLSLFPYPVTGDKSPSTIQFSAKSAPRLNLGRKWLMKLRRLPQSARKRFYELERSTAEFFAPIK